ncbi:hypothetical protein [Kitasatospora kifunensis]|uniref:Uncharacterized protein n=1 Tax=Kitasatospora kifunensis TaxID=58351 RepID=A0A7W7VZ94_KITKI|nr:hypothetical protein [Kitasatospora kifunensis]MBB4928542.1 hypothetical protein [Kitasatospora kifunensis]
MTAITDAWVYKSNTVGFRRGTEVHVTDWGRGTIKALNDLINGLPWANPDCVFHWHNSGAYGVILGDETYISDSPGIRKIHDKWPSLPNDWSDGITDAWVYESGEVGFRRGTEVHVTDWGQGTIKALDDLINGLPWANPDCVFHWQNSGAYGVILGDETYISDSPGIRKIHDQWPSLPSDW